MEIGTPTEYGGYEYEFLKPVPDRCICNICHLASRDAYMTGQCCRGLTICKSCLDQWQKQPKKAAICPVCRNKKGSFHPNYPIAREVNSLHIYCTNKEKGCEWHGELNDINKHLGKSDGCQFEEVKCSNECGKMIQRRYLISHVETECPRRKVNCQYCHATGEHQFIESQHKEECPKLPLPCPNKCEVGSVPREDMEAHRKECSLETIQCEYYSVGCKVRMARKDMVKHKNEKMEEHLMKTNLALKHELMDTKGSLADINTRLSKTERMLTNTKSALTDTNTKLAATQDQLDMALQRINTLEVMLYLSTDKPVKPKISHATVLESSVGWSDKLGAMAMMSKRDNQVCPVTIQLSKYVKKRRNRVQWYSDPFYTQNNGYKMCLYINVAGCGDGRGTHLSVFMCLMEGPHDDELTWPLRGRFEIKLLNQMGDSEHHSMTIPYNYDTPDSFTRRVTGDQIGCSWGFAQYASNTIANRHLKDDCLFFRVTKL